MDNISLDFSVRELGKKNQLLSTKLITVEGAHPISIKGVENINIS